MTRWTPLAAHLRTATPRRRRQEARRWAAIGLLLGLWVLMLGVGLWLQRWGWLG